MDKYITAIIYVLLLINIIFYFLLIRKREKTITLSRGAILNIEELGKYAKTIAIDHNISREIDPNTFPIKELNEYFDYITKTYDILNDSIAKKVSIPPSGEWLLDNFYIIEEQVNSLSKELSFQEYMKLPAVSGISRIYLLAREIVTHTDGNIDENIIETFISAYQDKKTLSMSEIWVLPIMLRIAIVENIKYICEKIYSSQLQKFKVESIIERHIENKAPTEQRFSNYKNIVIGAETTAFIEHMIYSLKKYGREAQGFIEAVEEEVNKVGTSTSEIIREEHFDLALRRVSMGNSILSIKNISRLDWTKIFEKINEIEKILEQDEYYKKSNFNTRSMYREHIQLIADKLNVSEMYIAAKLIDCMRKYNGIHIGNFILGDEKNILFNELGYEASFIDRISNFIKKHKTLVYIFCIYGTTLITSIIMAKQYFWLVFFPISEIFVTLYNKILSKMIVPQILPSLEEVPDNIKTFIVVPTLLNNSKRVKDLIQRLEVYYLGNKMDNISFALLGDASEVNSEKMDYDDEIAIVGQEETRRLNKKYGKDLFFFLYRKRVYNNKQEKWLGYERKRGMLTEFNNYLQTGEIGTFAVNTINKNKEELKSYKYIITLDADTALTLDAAKRLICIMEHPLNTPVIRNKTVVKGYGIIQPKVGISIESSTSSRFAKIFAGSGGIDVYSTAESNVYQDVFGEAIFTGKGIFNISVFQQLLKKEIPENTVLSHDLLEGSYIRCGLASNIEVIDDFPSRVNSYMLRLHRWTRGDWQIKKWIVRGPLNTLSRYKIFDNLRRSVIDIFTLALFFKGYLILPLLVIFFPLILDVIGKVINEKSLKIEKRNKNYLPIICGLKGSFYRCFISLFFLPYKALLMLDAIIITLYRVHISRKHLLEWVTAADAEKMLGKDLKSFVKEMGISALIGIILVEFSILFRTLNLYAALVLLFIWTFTPIISWYISRPEIEKTESIKEKDKDMLTDIARRTWEYFNDNVNEENNYLPPDNYQEKRKHIVANFTSATNIGLSLVSIISAEDMGFINKEEAYRKLNSTIDTINKLPKWNGHIYNWYNIKTLEPLMPRFISSVDSGNFIGCLYVVLSYLLEIESAFESREGITSLRSVVSELINNCNFSYLYDFEKQLFSIGFDIEENKLVDSYYDLLASEARTASLIAIAKKEVPYKHWFNLGRALTTLDGYKGLVSWAGTSFEYFMPYIFMKNYKYTLLDETYSFSLYSQKKYAKKLNIPWGISESAFNLQDLNFNYQYKAFGIPWLGLKRGLKEEIVVAPYGSIITLGKEYRDAIENIKILKDEGVYDKYGFYDSVDFTPTRVTKGNKREVVKTYMAHHQALILLAINNFLNNKIIQRRFHQNPEIRAVEMLLQERIPQNVIFMKEKKEKVTTLKYKDYEEYSERVYNKAVGNVNILSNDNYTLLINDRGEGYSTIKNILINRYKEDYKLSNTFFIKNIRTNRVWSNTLEPYETKPERYSVVFTPASCKFSRTDGQIDTITKIVVAPDDNVEIRRLEIRNTGNENIDIEIMSYLEPVLTKKENDIIHPAFNNLFLSSERYKTGCIIKRRARKKDEPAIHLINYIVGEGIDNTEIEVDKYKFIGRGRELKNASAVKETTMFSNEAVVTPDAIVSLKNIVNVKANDSVALNYIYAVGETRNEVVALYEKYNNIETIERTFDLALSRSLVENRFFEYRAKDIENYNYILSQIIEGSHTRDKYRNEILNNKLKQENLWSFGLSGDLPIVLLKIKNANDVEIVKQLIYAQEYFVRKNVRFDIVILDEEGNRYEQYVKEKVYEVVNNRGLNYLLNSSGGIFIIKSVNIKDEEKKLLYACSSIILDARDGLLEEQIQIENEYSRYTIPQKSPNEFKEYDVNTVDIRFDELLYFNEYGAFSKDGKEYIVRIRNKELTPLPWSNVIANKEFGTVVTVAGGGYTWMGNSRDNKLTVWSNNLITDKPSEIIYIKDIKQNIVWTPTAKPITERNEYIIRNGYGYTVYEHFSNGIKQELTVFVPKEGQQKINILKLKNIDEKRKLKIYYYIDPVLGVSKDYTKSHIITEKKEGENYITLKNKYNDKYANQVTYIASTEKINSYTNNKNIFTGESDLSSPDGVYYDKLSATNGISLNPCAAIEVEIEINNNEEKEIIFILGQADENISINVFEKEKYINELNKVKEYWNDMLDIIQVRTPVESMNIMLNGWLLYQTIACRLFARTSFYQAGGAFGFRDQLQDVLSLLLLNSEFAREQIIYHSKHQFEEGDVQHWWHPEKDNGVRTRFTDDLLWLPYAVYEYINTTGDYGILDEVTPYIQMPALKEDEDELYSNSQVSEKSDDIYNHCIKAIDKSLRFAANGLPEIGSGDWNDGMNNIKGESVWLGFFLYDVLNKFIKICEMKNDNDRKKIYIETMEKLKQALNTSGWDGRWYKRAYFKDGTALGSVQNDECKIDGISQSWATISDAGENDKKYMAMDSLDSYLVDRENMIIKLLTPPLDKTSLEPGYIKSYIPGVRENGGQYTHGAIWSIIANAKLGLGDRAGEYFRFLNPIEHTRTSEAVRKYKAEPYVVAADVYSAPNLAGRGGWTWYTGSSSWLYIAGIRYILGIKKVGNKLNINPCIPSEWKEFQVEYKYLNTLYKIYVKNPKGLCLGVKRVVLDNNFIDNNEIILTNDEKTHIIEVELG